VSRGAKSRMRRTETPKLIYIKYCMAIGVTDVVTCKNFGAHSNQVSPDKTITSNKDICANSMCPVHIELSHAATLVTQITHVHPINFPCSVTCFTRLLKIDYTQHTPSLCIQTLLWTVLPELATNTTGKFSLDISHFSATAFIIDRCIL